MGNPGKFMTVAMLMLGAGCVHQHRDLAPPEVPLDIQAAQVMPQPAKNRVHVAFVGGAVDFAGLAHLRAELIDLGFIKTYAGHVGQKAGFLAAFGDARLREPDARFALVGHGNGAVLAGELARQLEAEGAPVDLVLFLDPVGKPAAPPGRVVCLTTIGKGVEGAENYRLEASPLGAAKHPATRTVLLRELVEVASRVRVMDSEAVPIAQRGEWDFLMPQGPSPAVPCGKPILEAALTPAG